MSHPALDQLVREHDNMATFLVMLDSHFATMKSGEGGDFQLMLDAMTYLTEFVDLVHHRKEDVAVSEARRRSRSIRNAQPELDQQHHRIQTTGGRLRADLETAALDAPVKRDTLADEGFAYTTEVRRNIEYEELHVFPALTRALGDDAWSRIGARLQGNNDPLFSDVTEDRYVDLLRELTERFAGGPLD